MAGTLRLVANPYTCIDGEGRPMGVLPCDPIGHTPDRRFVGAKIDPAKTVVHEKVLDGELRSARQTTIFVHASEPETVPTTPYYMNAVRNGAAFAADAETARTCCLAFVPPEKLLAEACAKAAGEWFAMYGTPAPFAPAKTEAPKSKPAPAAPVGGS